METFKNTEVAQIYKVSNTAITRWVDAALKGNNNLQLFELGGKHRILKSKHNEAELERLRNIGTVFKNKSERIEIVPQDQFYEVFDESQVVEIINYLETKSEIPHKFTYLGKGGEIWNSFIDVSTPDKEYVTTSSDTVLLRENYDFLKTETDKYDEIKIVEIGAGNMYPTKPFVEKLASTGKLKSYTAVDISKSLIEITENNFKKWDIPVIFDYYVADIEHDNLSKIFFRDKTNTDGRSMINIIMCVDMYGNLDNRRKALENLRTSMGKDDLLVITNRKDSKSGRVDLGFLAEVYDLFLWIPELLNLSVDQTEIITEYNSDEGRREARIKLDKDYIITFKIGSTERVVNLYKSQEIIVWFSYMSSLNSIIEEQVNVGLEPIHITTHNSLSRILVISEAKNLN